MINTPRIPDMLFIRDFDAETQGRFALAGMLVVRRKSLGRAHQEAIAEIIRRLVEAVKDEPGLDAATVNFDGSATTVGDDAWMGRNFNLPHGQCTRVVVRVDQAGRRLS
jgi:hypothetical protein